MTLGRGLGSSCGADAAPVALPPHAAGITGMGVNFRDSCTLSGSGAGSAAASGSGSADKKEGFEGGSSASVWMTEATDSAICRNAETSVSSNAYEREENTKIVP